MPHVFVGNPLPLRVGVLEPEIHRFLPLYSEVLDSQRLADVCPSYNQEHEA